MIERSRPSKGSSLLGAAGLLTAAILLAGCGSSAATARPSAQTATAGPSAGPTSAASACSTPAPAGTAYQQVTCQIAAPSLAGNLLGDRMANHMLPFMIAKLATE